MRRNVRRAIPKKNTRVEPAAKNKRPAPGGSFLDADLLASVIGAESRLQGLVVAQLPGEITLVADVLDEVELRFEPVDVLFFVFQDHG